MLAQVLSDDPAAAGAVLNILRPRSGLLLALEHARAPGGLGWVAADAARSTQHKQQPGGARCAAVEIELRR